MFFQGVLKRDLWLSGPLFWGADGGEWQSVGYEEHLDYWRPENTTSIFGPNTDAYYPKAYIGDKGNKNKLTQTGYLQNGAYMRMKNLQVGYTFPKAWTSKVNIEKYACTSVQKTCLPSAVLLICSTQKPLQPTDGLAENLPAFTDLLIRYQRDTLTFKHLNKP